MKRWTIRIAVCLILGAVTTVAVAAWVQWRMPIRLVAGKEALATDEINSIWREYGIFDVDRWSLQGWRSDCLASGERLVGNSFIGSSAGEELGLNVGSSSRIIQLLETGLPLRSIACARVTVVLGTSRAQYSIIWRGFAVDSLFYGAIWFAMFFGFTSAKRFIRTRRGRCPDCGYDLRGQRAEVSGQKSEVSSPHPGPPPRAPGGLAEEGVRCPECGWNSGGSSTS